MERGDQCPNTGESGQPEESGKISVEEIHMFFNQRSKGERLDFEWPKS